MVIAWKQIAKGLKFEKERTRERNSNTTWLLMGVQEMIMEMGANAEEYFAMNDMRDDDKENKRILQDNLNCSKWFDKGSNRCDRF